MRKWKNRNEKVSIRLSGAEESVWADPGASTAEGC